MITKEEILSQINFRSFYKTLIPSLKMKGKAETLGLCPFHEDHNPSLSVNLESGLFNCFVCGAGGDIFKFYQDLRKVDFPTALKQVADLQGIRDTAIKPELVATFNYKDADGNILYKKERYEPGFTGKRKDFVFKHNVNGQWATVRGCDPVLYNLPEIIKNRHIYIVEGEAKTDLLMKWGFPATCLDSGASSPWRDDYLKILEGKEKVVIMPDNDESGRSYASRIAHALYDKVGSLKFVELPGLPEKGDITNWAKIEANNKERLIEIIDSTPEWQPQPEKEQQQENKEQKMILTRLSDLFKEPEEDISFHVEGMLPTGGFSVLGSKPKAGKSTTARNLALCTARGEEFLNRKVNKGSVIYYALEEKRSEVKKHFRDMGASGKEDIYIYSGTAPIDAINQIKEITESLKPVLIIIDPLFRLARVKDGNSNDYVAVTQALEPLLRLARDTGAHVLCVHHTSKGDRQGGDSVLGSTAIFSSVDTLLLMKRHENYRTISSIQRYGTDLEETTLTFDDITRTISIGKSKHEEDTEQVKKAITEFLSSQNDPVIESIIADEVEGRTGLKRKALRDLVKEGKIKREGKGGKGDPFKYSCFVVPDIYKEQGNKNNENEQKPHNQAKFSCSQENSEVTKDDKNTGTSNITPDEKKEVIDLTGDWQ